MAALAWWHFVEDRPGVAVIAGPVYVHTRTPSDCCLNHGHTKRSLLILCEELSTDVCVNCCRW
jgi:hypothetical protein